MTDDERELNDLIAELSRARDIRREHLSRRSREAKSNDPILCALYRVIDFLAALRADRERAR